MKFILKYCFYLLCFLLIHASSICQEKKKILKSWIKREIYTLPDNRILDDTMYTRYSFQKNKVDISFNPGWIDFLLEWQLKGDQLTMGFTTYTVEEISDSTLVISKAGLRRIVLDDENYLNQKSENLHIIGTFNNEPLYEGNKFITPRYRKEGFRNFIEQNLNGYNIHKAMTFIASFIVKKDGSVDNVKIIKGITEGFDAEVASQLKKTSKNWSPAVYRGQPIQTQMIYTIKYLDSIDN